MKKYILTSAVILLGLPAMAQNISPRDNLAWDMNYYNPAIVTKPKGVFVDFYGRYEINSVKNLSTNPVDIAAETFVIRDNYSWEASLSHDALSYYDGTMFDVSYAHLWTFGRNKEHGLRAGGRFDLGYVRVDFSKLDYGQSGYQIMVRPDIDLGLEYRYKFFHVGFCIKNTMSIPFKEKDGIVYCRYPRAYMGHIMFDVNLWDDKIGMNPYFVLGMNQNIFIDAGLSISLWDYVGLNYCFHGPDLSHNVGLCGYICKRVLIEGGYCFSPSHHTSAATLKLCVRLAD